MDTITRDVVAPLAERVGWPLVSVYLPAHRLRIQSAPDRIAMRNLLAEARRELVKGGARESEADTLLAEAHAFADDDAEWTGGFEGLAVFMAPGSTEFLRLETAVPEIAVAGDRFFLRPLFRVYHGSEHFWALAIDLNCTRLFSCDRNNVEEVALPKGTPTTILDITKYENREELEGYHTIPTATPEGIAQGETSAMFFGHGGEKDVEKTQRMQFVQALDHGVTKVLGAQSTEPLVLLGADYLLADYREVCTYAHLYPHQVEGATDYLEARDVQAAAWMAVEPAFAATAEADVDELRQLLGTPRASEDPAQIVKAAAAGQVKTLFFGDGAGPYGWFDRATFDVTHLCPAEPGTLRADLHEAHDFDILECGWDLVDLAAAETVLHRGDVHAFTGEDAPVAGAAAVFRY